MRHHIRTIAACQQSWGWSRFTPAHWGIFIALMLGTGMTVFAIVTDLTLVSELEMPQGDHVNQVELNAIADAQMRFETAFETGDVLFETAFNTLDGVGAQVGAGQRFSPHGPI